MDLHSTDLEGLIAHLYIMTKFTTLDQIFRIATKTFFTVKKTTHFVFRHYLLFFVHFNLSLKLMPLLFSNFRQNNFVCLFVCFENLNCEERLKIAQVRRQIAKSHYSGFPLRRNFSCSPILKVCCHKRL